MNIFDIINKALGKPTSEDVKEAERRRQDRRRREREAAKPKAPEKEQPLRKFTPNDTDYWRERGAKSETESQRRVDEYRQSQQPGIKPLYPEARELKKVTAAPQQVVRPQERKRAIGAVRF